MSGENALSQQPERERQPLAPRVYVASLSDYNAGILHGTWLDAAQEPVALWAGVNQMLADSPAARRWGEAAEEHAIHDYEGFGPVRLGEYEPVEAISVLARGIVARGEAFAAWWTITDEPAGEGDLEEVLERFDQDHAGTFESVEDYAAYLLEVFDFDPDTVSSIPDILRPYLHLNVQGFMRDLQAGGDITIEEGSEGLHVFWG